MPGGAQAAVARVFSVYVCTYVPMARATGARRASTARTAPRDPFWWSGRVCMFVCMYVWPPSGWQEPSQPSAPTRAAHPPAGAPEPCMHAEPRAGRRWGSSARRGSKAPSSAGGRRRLDRCRGSRAAPPFVRSGRPTSCGGGGGGGGGGGTEEGGWKAAGRRRGRRRNVLARL